jgi:hypothetical protein
VDAECAGATAGTQNNQPSPRLVDFVNVAVGGFPAETVADTSRKAKALLGKFAYFATGLANISCLAAKSKIISGAYTGPRPWLDENAKDENCRLNAHRIDQVSIHNRR